MKIESSTIALAAESKKSEAYHKRESLDVAYSDGTVLSTEKVDGFIEDQVVISDDVRVAINQASKNPQGPGNISIGAGFDFNISKYQQSQIDVLTRMIQALTGKKMKFVLPNQYMRHSLKGEAVRMEAQRMSIRIAGGNGSKGGTKVSSGEVIGMDYRATETYVEKETMNFAATGKVVTSDGREIDFSAALSMDREFVERNHISYQSGVLNTCDPLVINFDSPGTELTDTKYSFDLDCDGLEDNISFATDGSGFLALDINGDGTINDGSELFGAKTGDGFADLAAHDGDGNGWIDENDAIYDKLRIWTKDENGNDTLMALGVKGVGAIYLGSTESEFTIKNVENEALGVVRKTGVFLNENGSVGTVQHVDLCL